MKGNKPEPSGKLAAEAAAARVAAQQALELVEVTLRKEPQGLTLCLYIDKPDGVSLDDCERFHRAVQPELENVEYDFLEVSSPGADRPIENRRDFEKKRDALVEVKLYAPLEGCKRFEGKLVNLDDDGVTLCLADGKEKTFPRKAVALVKPIIILDEEEQE